MDETRQQDNLSAHRCVHAAEYAPEPDPDRKGPEVILETITSTTTGTNTELEVELDTTVTDAQIDALAMTRHRFHGDPDAKSGRPTGKDTTAA
ncbi:hypothetical protein [Streptomyces sp. NBC_01618]|uniref:hypothetical protein n=1 Tax=Streptomyces sp. NBC_01618 TaxID=2975900 RepID=UPI003865FD8F|nr:hypothetical protein OH735_31065 [Streptomyces sp. NBC_01618]